MIHGRSVTLYCDNACRKGNGCTILSKVKSNYPPCRHNNLFPYDDVWLAFYKNPNLYTEDYGGETEYPNSVNIIV